MFINTAYGNNLSYDCHWPGDGDMFAMFPRLYSARCPAAVENSLMCDTNVSVRAEKC